MIFSDMQTEVSDRAKAYDSTVSADLTKIKRWINMAQQDICARRNWPFMLYHEIIQTVADITTGTVSINSASTSLTFSSGPTASVTDRFIQFSTSDDWYKISSHTAASTSATITPAYGGSSNISGGTYTVRKIFYATTTPLDSILDIKKTVNGRFLGIAPARYTDVFLPLYYDAGEIYNYISSVPDSTGGVRISFLYSPSSVENLQVRGIKKLADLSADADVSLIPARWHSAILDLASFYAFSSLDDTRAKDFLIRAEQIILAMVETFDYDLGRQRVAQSLDMGLHSGPEYTLPSNYGVMEG